MKSGGAVSKAGGPDPFPRGGEECSAGHSNVEILRLVLATFT